MTADTKPTLLLGVKWVAAPTVSGQWAMPAVRQRTRAICLPHHLLPACSALLPSHATLPTINRTRAAGPFDCVIPRSSRVPKLKSPRSQQLQAHARVCQLAPVLYYGVSSFRLTDFLHGSLARPGLACLPASYWVPPPLSPSSLLLPSVYGLASTGCGTDTARFFCRKQGSSSFLATPYCNPSDP